MYNCLDRYGIMRPTVLSQNLFHTNQDEQNENQPVFGSIYSEEEQNKIIMEAIEKEKNAENDLNEPIHLSDGIYFFLVLKINVFMYLCVFLCHDHRQTKAM